MCLRDVLELLVIECAKIPLKNLLKGVLLALLIGSIVAEIGLLVELREGIGGLLEADLQTIQMRICSTLVRRLLLKLGWLTGLLVKGLGREGLAAKGKGVLRGELTEGGRIEILMFHKV